jgi:hypothetical protein
LERKKESPLGQLAASEKEHGHFADSLHMGEEKKKCSFVYGGVLEFYS